MHKPVLLSEVMQALQPKDGGRYLDVTLGGGGHAAAVLQASAPSGRLMGTDADGEAIRRCEQRLAVFAPRVQMAQAWMDDAVIEARQNGFLALDGILADLGLSSFQLDEAGRGFAFKTDGPLDMRFDNQRGVSVAEWIDHADLEMMTHVLREYGEVDNARRVADAILSARPLRSTGDLKRAVERVARQRPGKRIHPATLVFQALRIAANDELNRLSRALPQFVDALAVGGRLAVITFHSLEDRIVKDFFRDEATETLPVPGFGLNQPEKQARLKLITKKPVEPGEAEIADNPRARSAKLRVAEKLAVLPPGGSHE